MHSSQAKDTVNSSAKRSNKFNADFSQADDMGNDTLLTEVDNSEVFDSKNLVNLQHGDVTEVNQAQTMEHQKKSDMQDAVTNASLTPRLDSHQPTKLRTENNSELKKGSRGINQVRNTGRDLKMRGPSKAGSSVNVFKQNAKMSSTTQKINTNQKSSIDKEGEPETEQAQTEFLADYEPSETA